MGRRKNQNNQSSNPALQPTKSRSTENGAAGGNANESSNVDEILWDPEEFANSQPVEESFPDGDDKTSADYYFGSCSHFGTASCFLLSLVFEWEILLFRRWFAFLDFLFLAMPFSCLLRSSYLKMINFCISFLFCRDSWSECAELEFGARSFIFVACLFLHLGTFGT